MSESRRRQIAVGGLVAILAAACRAAPPPEALLAPTAAATADVPATPSAAPWVLVDTDLPAEVLEAVAAWAAGMGQEAQARDLNSMSEDPQPGLWAVVGLEENLTPLSEAWRQDQVASVVIHPSSLTAGERTSTLGPEIAYDEAGFLAGVAAGLATRSGLIGVVPGGGEAGGWRMGFEQGLLYSCPKCRLEAISDPGRSAFAMDVVGVPPEAGMAPSEPASVAVWLVVFEHAPDGWSERVAARVRLAPEAQVGPALTRLGDGMPGEAWVIAVPGGGLAIDVDPRAISPGRERLLREAEADLAEGTLVVVGG